MKLKRRFAGTVAVAVATWPLAQTTCSIDPSDLQIIIFGDDDDDDHHGLHFHDDDGDPIFPWEFDRIDDIDW